MPWKHCFIRLDECYERIRDGVDLLLLGAGDTQDVALFSRTTADRRRRVLLLTPRAVELAGTCLSERWVECDGPELFEWDLVIGTPGVCERMGLCRPRFGRFAQPGPVTMIGRDPRANPA
jgi:hypothetical protein